MRRREIRRRYPMRICSPELVVAEELRCHQRESAVRIAWKEAATRICSRRLDPKIDLAASSPVCLLSSSPPPPLEPRQRLSSHAVGLSSPWHAPALHVLLPLAILPAEGGRPSASSATCGRLRRGTPGGGRRPAAQRVPSDSALQRVPRRADTLPRPRDLVASHAPCPPTSAPCPPREAARPASSARARRSALTAGEAIRRRRAQRSAERSALNARRRPDRHQRRWPIRLPRTPRARAALAAARVTVRRCPRRPRCSAGVVNKSLRRCCAANDELHLGEAGRGSW